MSEFFGTSLRRGAEQPRDLLSRIDLQLRERLEEAVDLAGIDILVQRRKAHGLTEPTHDNPADRQEFEATVHAFLERLHAELAPAVSDSARARAEGGGRAATERVAALLATQVLLAKELPDYWQRFEQVRATYTAERISPSGSERRGLLGRLLGRD